MSREKTPLEMALEREAKGEIDYCDECEHIRLVRRAAYCGISGKLLHPLMYTRGEGTGPARQCKRRKGEKMNPNKQGRVIAVDFDGCLCVDRYPHIGKPNHRVIDAAKNAQRDGAKLILWTCREGELLDAAIAAAENWGLHFDAINDSLPHWKEAWGNNPRKIGATEYWDDKAVTMSEDVNGTGNILTARDSDGEPYIVEATGSRAQHIISLLAAEAQDRLVVLPCKVGDTVWMIVTKRPKVTMPEFSFIKRSRLTWNNMYRVIQDFGKTVFLTREEAEAALAKEANP